MSLLTPMIIEVNPPIMVPSIVSPPEPVLNPVEFILDGTVTNGSELIITDLSSDFIKYELNLVNVVAVGQSQTNLALTTSTNNGSSFATSASAYILQIQRSSGSGDGATWHYKVSSTRAILINGLSNTSGDQEFGIIEIFDPMDAGSKTTLLSRTGGKINADSDTMNPNVADVMSQREVAEANNAIRIFAVNDSGTTGNFSMKYSLIGYRKEV